MLYTIVILATSHYHYCRHGNDNYLLVWSFFISFIHSFIICSLSYLTFISYLKSHITTISVSKIHDTQL